MQWYDVMLFSYERVKHFWPIIILASPKSRNSDFQIQVKMFQDGKIFLIITIAEGSLSLPPGCNGLKTLEGKSGKYYETQHWVAPHCDLALYSRQDPKVNWKGENSKAWRKEPFTCLLNTSMLELGLGYVSHSDNIIDIYTNRRFNKTLLIWLIWKR